MLYRAAMIGIAAFWLVMMGLLVRLETHPEATDILEVPVSYVMRLMFKHGERSILTVHDGTHSAGTVALQPLTTGSDGRSLAFSGSIAIPPQQGINFNGATDMDAALRVRAFHVDLSLRQPHCHVSITGDSARNTLRYEVREGTQLTAAQTLPMDAGGMGAALAQNLGLDPHSLPITPASIAPPVVTARETQVVVRGEQLEVYQVTVMEGGAPVIDFYVTQLGQIVQARTNFGYSLDAEDWQ
jgi:hypothetical protein